MVLLTVLIVSLVSYFDYGGSITRFVEGEPDATRELPGPGYPGSPDPDEQLAMASGEVPEELVVQEGQLHARSDDSARNYAGQEQAAQHDTDTDEVLGAGEQRRQFKLPKLPIPSGILDIPKLIPTGVKDILSDLPPVPTIPTDPGDIIDQLPTDPGELISDLPIPSLPTIPAIPTLPVPIPIPTEVPELPVPTKIPTKIPEIPDFPGWPLPTGKPGDPKDIYKLPDLTEIPHRVLNVLHGAISKLSTADSTPKYLRDLLRLILRILNRLAGGDPVPKPPKAPAPTAPTLTLPLPIPTLPLPTIPTDLPIPTLPTGLPTRTLTRLPPLPTLPPLPRPTLTLAHRLRQQQQPGSKDGGGSAKRKVRGVRGGKDGDKEPLSDERRKELRDAVSDEVWAAADWSNPLVASVTAAWAMFTFDAIYRVAEAFKATDDEAERERLLDSFVVVGDEEIEGVA